MQVITSYEFPAILHERIPEMKDSDSSLRPLLRVFAAINSFADFTGSAIRDHHYLLAGKCFMAADHFYKSGDRMVRSLIKHSFVPSLINCMPAEATERAFIQTLIPIALYNIFEEEMEDGDHQFHP